MCDGSERLTHLLFADDTTLTSRSRRCLQNMLRDIRQAFASVGLRLNFGKCKIQTNSYTRATVLRVGDMSIPIVSAHEGFQVLGTQYTVLGRVSRELNRRVAAAWGKFHQIRRILQRRHIDLKRRLLLFDSVVGSSMLWCCESWTLTTAEKRVISTTQRAMMRRFVASRKSPTENAIEWLIRVTHQAEQRAKSVGLELWLDKYLRKEWSWAGHVARMSSDRWAQRVTKWRDQDWWLVERPFSHRPVHAKAGAPSLKWESDFVRFAHQRGWQSWYQNAAKSSREEWNDMAKDFIQSSRGSIRAERFVCF